MYITTIKKEIIDVYYCYAVYSIDSASLLQRVDKININSCKLKTEFGNVYDFKDIFLYDLTERLQINGQYHNYYKHIYINFKHRNKNIDDLQVISHNKDEVVMCEYSDEQYEWDDII